MVLCSMKLIGLEGNPFCRGATAYKPLMYACLEVNPIVFNVTYSEEMYVYMYVCIHIQLFGIEIFAFLSV